MMRRIKAAGWAALTFVFSFCTNTENKNNGASVLYATVMISGEEEQGVITGFLQFRTGSHNGKSVLLHEPSKIELDGEVLQPDSAGMSGAFYEFQRPLQEFGGQHTLRYTDAEGTPSQESFSFTPFYFVGEPAERISRERMMFNIGGFEGDQVLRVVLSDTAYYTTGVNEWDTVRNGQLDLRDKLKNVSNGPMVLQLYQETERPIRNIPSLRGTISMSYGVKREFVLID